MSDGHVDAAATPPEAFAAALTSLPGMGPARLAAVLGRWDPEEAWARILAGDVACERSVASACRPDPEAVVAAWRSAARSADVGARWEAHLAHGVRTSVRGQPGYPPVLADDHEAPAVVFSRGDLGVLAARRAAIVGTRRCTRYGRDVAAELGRDLAANGVCVVSGLALGIDGAAHAGALAASGGPPVGVVGSGLDVVYPRRHRPLWEQVAAVGALLSEAPLGAPPEPWRFPVRNRIIAALAEVVVVVESRHAGGSRHTVDAAMARDRPVLAVPGPVRSAASELPNALLAEGCAPARDALDVLVALDLSLPPVTPADARPPPDPDSAAVLELLGWEPVTFEQVVLAAGKSPAEIGVALARLERDGWVMSSGGWWERCARGVAGT